MFHVLTSNAQPWINQEMPRASFISSFDPGEASNQCIQIEPEKALQLNFGSQMTVKDVLVVTEVVSVEEEPSDADGWLEASNEPSECLTDTDYQGAYYGENLKISYKTDGDPSSTFVEKTTLSGI